MEQLLPLPNPMLCLILISLHGKTRYFIPMGALGLHMALEQFKCIYAGVISCDQQWDCTDEGLPGNLWDEANQQDLPGHAQPRPIPSHPTVVQRGGEELLLSPWRTAPGCSPSLRSLMCLIRVFCLSLNERCW